MCSPYWIRHSDLGEAAEQALDSALHRRLRLGLRVLLGYLTNQHRNRNSLGFRDTHCLYLLHDCSLGITFGSPSVS